jgi:hypothetical protein
MILSLKQQLGIYLLLAFLFCFECCDCSGGAPTRDPEISELSARQRVKRGQEMGKAGTLKMHEKYIFPRLGYPDPRSPRAQAFRINKPNFSYPMMLISSLVAAVRFLAAGSQARYVKRDDGLTIFSRKAVAKCAPSEIVATSIKFRSSFDMRISCSFTPREFPP